MNLKNISFVIVLFVLVFSPGNLLLAQYSTSLFVSDHNLNAIAYGNQGFLTIIGDDGVVLRGQYNYGKFSAVESGVKTSLRDIRYYANCGYVVGDTGAILKTTNNGETWAVLNSGVTTNLRGVTHWNADTAWAVGDGGCILRTNDGGLSWAPQVSGVNKNLNSISSNIFDRNLYAAGDNGIVLVSTDGGANWVKQTLPVSVNLYKISATGAMTVAVGDSGSIIIRFNSQTDWVACQRTTNATLKGIGTSEYGGNVTIWGDGIILQNFGCIPNAFSTHAIDTSFHFSGAAAYGAADMDYFWGVGKSGLFFYFGQGTLVKDEHKIAGTYQLSHNYPNPFNPTTNISFQIPSASNVTLDLFSITGEKISSLVNEHLQSGYYTQQINAEALHLASGTYLCRMLAVDELTGKTFTQTQKLVLMK